MKNQLKIFQELPLFCWLRSQWKVARQRIGAFLDWAYYWLEDRSDHEKVTAVVASFLLLIAADLLLGLHQAWKHVFYLPIWFAAWFLPRKAAVAIALFASAWLIVSPLLRGEPYNAALVLGMFVALASFHFGCWSLSFLRAVFDREHTRARIDSLTGCLNASGLYEEAETELEEIRQDFRPFALVYIDLDNFKMLNDTLGHLVADEALRKTGIALRSTTRNSDFVARMGGDEFVIWLNHIGPDLAFVVARRIQEAILQVAKEGNWRFSASLGCVAFAEPPESVHAALQLADECMYRAKSTGKSKIVSELWRPKVIAPKEGAAASVSVR